MADEVPTIRQGTRAASFEMLIRSSMRVYFNQRHEFEPKDLESHVFFLESIIFGSMQRYVKEGREHSIPRDEFLACLSRIMISYLEADQVR